METSMTVFQFESMPVRITDRDGAPWFVAADVCKVLKLRNTPESVRSLDDDERGSIRISDRTSPLGGNPNMTIISESGLYALIIRSNKPEARKFRKWITSEVLPAIRRQGHYIAGKADLPDSAEKAPLITTVMDMLRNLNARIIAGDDIPSHILKYAWNLANVSRDVGMRKYSGILGEGGQIDAETASEYESAIINAIESAVPLSGMQNFASDRDRVFIRSSVIENLFTGKYESGRHPSGVIRQLVNGNFITPISKVITRYPHHTGGPLRRSSGLMWNYGKASPVRVLDMKGGQIVEVERDLP